MRWTMIHYIMSIGLISLPAIKRSMKEMKVSRSSNASWFHPSSLSYMHHSSIKSIRVVIFLQIKENMSVHCGFHSEMGGFNISDEDKKFMLTCQAVVSTCAFGGGDDLYQPIGMTEASLEKVGQQF